jgi:hypothetical protein
MMMMITKMLVVDSMGKKERKIDSLSFEFLNFGLSDFCQKL